MSHIIYPEPAKQPLDATLTAFATLTVTANKLPYADGGESFALTDFTGFARTLLAGADAAAMRTTLELGSAALAATSAFEVPLTFSTGLTRSTNTITVNTTQNIAKLSNLTSNGFVKTGSGDGTLSVATSIVNADIDASAAIAVSKLAALTASRALVSDGSGFLSVAATTATEIGYVNGVTSAIQTQLNAKQASGNYITAITGDMTASGPGSAAGTLATVNSNVGSFTSANITVNAKGLITAASNGSGSIDINGLTSAAPVLDDTLPYYRIASSANRKATASYLAGLSHAIPGGRLTLSSGVPVTTSDVTGATTIYYTPYVSNTSVVWDGTAFKTISVGEVSTTLSGATSGLPYDVFQDSSGGIEVLAWTNTTTRATALVADAIGYTKSGDQTRRYLGTICMSGTGTCEDSKAKRFVWNMYNRVEYKDYRNDSTTSWTDSGNGTWSAIHGGDATWKHEFVRGINEDPVCAEAFLMAGEGYCYAIAMDSTSTLDRAKSTAAGQTPAGQVIGGAAFFRDMPSIGYHYLQALETSYTASAATCYGNLTPGGSTVAAQSGFLTSGRR